MYNGTVFVMLTLNTYLLDDYDENNDNEFISYSIISKGTKHFIN